MYLTYSEQEWLPYCTVKGATVPKRKTERKRKKEGLFARSLRFHSSQKKADKLRFQPKGRRKGGSFFHLPFLLSLICHTMLLLCSSMLAMPCGLAIGCRFQCCMFSTTTQLPFHYLRLICRGFSHVRKVLETCYVYQPLYVQTLLSYLLSSQLDTAISRYVIIISPMHIKCNSSSGLTYGTVCR